MMTARIGRFSAPPVRGSGARTGLQQQRLVARRRSRAHRANPMRDDSSESVKHIYAFRVLLRAGLL